MTRHVVHSGRSAAVHAGGGGGLLPVLCFVLALLVGPGQFALAQESDSPAETAQDAPAEVDPFRFVLSRWDDITVLANSAFQNASDDYGTLERRGGEAILFTLGSAHHAVATDATPDWHVAVDGMVGRSLILLTDYENARRWLESALELGEAAGLADEALNGILRDLAWLASQRGDDDAAVAYSARADACPLSCGADILWRAAQTAEGYSEEAQSILGRSEFWRRRAEDRRRDAEAFIRDEFGENSFMMARLLEAHAREIEKSDPAGAEGLIEQAVSLLRQNNADAPTIQSALLLRLGIVEAAGDPVRAAEQARELAAEAAAQPDAESLWIAVDAAEKRYLILREAGLGDAAAAYAEAVTLAVTAGGDRPVHRRLLDAGIEAGLDADAGRLADAMLLSDPASEDVLPLRLMLAERTGDTAAIERLNPILNPPAGRGPSDREIAIARFASDDIRYLVATPEELLERSDGWIARTAQSLREKAASAHTALSRLDASDDILVVEAVIARSYLVGREYDEAERRYAGILDEVERRGWPEARLSSIVADLAFLAEQKGDMDAAEAYRDRAAAACAVPCNEAVLRQVWIEARLAGMLTDRVWSDAEKRREVDSFFEDAIAYLEAAFGETASETISAWTGWALWSRGRDDRPWKTIELFQRLIDLGLATGKAPRDLLFERYAILRQFLFAGEYRRLAEFAGPFLADARAAGESHYDASRLRARALWHLGDPGARAAYREAIDACREFPSDCHSGVITGELLPDLVDAGYHEEIIELADRLIETDPGFVAPYLAKARVAADRGRYAEAAELLSAAPSRNIVAHLQRAHYLGRAGQHDEAAGLREAAWREHREASQEAADPFANWWTDIWSALSIVTHPRDAGAYEGAAEFALTLLPDAEEWMRLRRYVDAQLLWQLAFTLARGGEAAHSFRLMKAAAGIAVSHSFADANATDGGSLQLLRRDKFRYLLFVDIAWAYVSGRSPQSMSMSSRY